MTTDTTTPERVLASALHKAEVSCWPNVDGCTKAENHRGDALAILAHEPLRAALTRGLAGSGVVERCVVRRLDDKHWPTSRAKRPGFLVCDFDSMTWPCDTRKALDILAATPPTPALTAERLAEAWESDEGPNHAAWEQFGAVLESLAETMDDGPMVTNAAGVEFLDALARRGYRVGPYVGTPMVLPGSDDLARTFHEQYERLAPSFGYVTRRDSSVPWQDVPEPNRSLMLAVATQVLERWPALATPPTPVAPAPNSDQTPPTPGPDGGAAAPRGSTTGTQGMSSADAGKIPEALSLLVCDAIERAR